MRKKLAIVLCAVLLGYICALAQNSTANPKPFTYTPDIEKKAASGDITSLFKLGYCCYFANIGPLCSNSPVYDSSKQAEGYEYLLKASEKGHIYATFLVGCYYFYGIGGKSIDKQKARIYYEKASDAGCADAMLNLGTMYNSGDGVTKDTHKALMLTEKAANAGNAVAQQNMFVLLRESDPTRAISYLRKSAEQGHANAMRDLGVMTMTGQMGISVDVNKALQLEKGAAEKGNNVAMHDLGYFYANGLGVKKDLDKAAIYFYKGSKAGNQKARTGMSDCYKAGALNALAYDNYSDWVVSLAKQEKIFDGDKEDYTHPITTTTNSQSEFEKNLALAEQGDAKAQCKVGFAYNEGKGVEKDLSKAFYWYKKAADQGYALGQFNLGTLYDNGRGVEKDYKMAFQYYKKAAEQGYSSAQNNLGVCYRRGKGIPQDYDKAAYWFKKASDKGNKKAKTNLEDLEKVRKEEQQQRSIAVEDRDIPVTTKVSKDVFAVVIGNEKYNNEENVPYAENDAKIFKEYLNKTLGVPEKQIKFITNATLNNIGMSVIWLRQAMEICGSKGRVIFYYAGHGIPDEANRSAYLLPVDGTGSYLESAYPLDRLYSELGSMSGECALVFLDACFSGSKREGGMLDSARGVAIKTKPQTPKGNMIVFTAAQGDETAYPYKEKQHGMFTYYLLKKLRDSKGGATLGEIGDYLTNEVRKQSFLENTKKQTPTVNASGAMQHSWREMTIQ